MTRALIWMLGVARRPHTLLSGPPGPGKMILARRLLGILPPLEVEGDIEVTKARSAAGEGLGGLVRSRPFRAPHQAILTSGLAGGGTNPRSGEVSLSHRGVLFLDELPEFSRNTLEAAEAGSDAGELGEPLTEAEMRTLQRVVGFEPSQVDEISRHSGVGIKELPALSMLELKGYVMRDASGAFVWRGR